MTALLINPVEKTITRVPVTNDYYQLLAHIGCDTLTTFNLAPGVIGYCDDEGRLKPNQKCCTFPNMYDAPVAGNIYVCGFNSAGDNKGISQYYVDMVEARTFWLPDDYDYTPGSPVVISFNTVEEMMAYMFGNGK